MDGVLVRSVPGQFERFPFVYRPVRGDARNLEDHLPAVCVQRNSEFEREARVGHVLELFIVDFVRE